MIYHGCFMVIGVFMYKYLLIYKEELLCNHDVLNSHFLWVRDSLDQILFLS